VKSSQTTRRGPPEIQMAGGTSRSLRESFAYVAIAPQSTQPTATRARRQATARASANACASSHATRLSEKDYGLWSARKWFHPLKPSKQKEPAASFYRRPGLPPCGLLPTPPPPAKPFLWKTHNSLDAQERAH